MVAGADFTDWFDEITVGVGKRKIARVIREGQAIIKYTVFAQWGDWITKGFEGDFHLYQPDAFEQYYERAD